MYSLRFYVRRPVISGLLAVSLFLNLLSFGWLFFSIEKQSDPLFLHYTVLFGVDYTGDWYRIFLVPLGGLFVLILNFFLGWFFFHKDAFVAYLLASVSLLVQVILFVTSLLLVFLNV